MNQERKIIYQGTQKGMYYFFNSLLASRGQWVDFEKKERRIPETEVVATLYVLGDENNLRQKLEHNGQVIYNGLVNWPLCEEGEELVWDLVRNTRN